MKDVTDMDGPARCTSFTLKREEHLKRMAIIVTLIMEAASASETQINFYQSTRRNNPEDGHHHTRRVRT
jgi:hypothetical protein